MNPENTKTTSVHKSNHTNATSTRDIVNNLQCALYGLHGIFSDRRGQTDFQKQKLEKRCEAIESQIEILASREDVTSGQLDQISRTKDSLFGTDLPINEDYQRYCKPTFEKLTRWIKEMHPKAKLEFTDDHYQAPRDIIVGTAEQWEVIDDHCEPQSDKDNYYRTEASSSTECLVEPEVTTTCTSDEDDFEFVTIPAPESALDGEYVSDESIIILDSNC